MDDISHNEVRFKGYARYVHASLQDLNYELTEFEEAEIIIGIAYSNQRHEEEYTYQVPIFGIVGYTVQRDFERNIIGTLPRRGIVGPVLA